MAATFNFALVSPERLLVPEHPAHRDPKAPPPATVAVSEVIIPGQEGDLAALPLHAPLIAQLRPGILTIPSLNGRRAEFYLRGGFADVGPTETVVLAEYAVPIEDFNAALMTDEIALAQAEYDDATTDEGRFYAQDRLERVQSLRDRLALS